MSHQKTTVTQQKEHKFDISAVWRLIKGTIYREKTEIINPWGVRRPPTPLNDAPEKTTNKNGLLGGKLVRGEALAAISFWA